MLNSLTFSLFSFTPNWSFSVGLQRFAVEAQLRHQQLQTAVGSVALSLSGAVHSLIIPSSGDGYFVLHVRLAGEAMASADHTHHFESLDGGRRSLHCLKASRGSTDSLERSMVRFDDVVQVLAGAMPRGA